MADTYMVLANTASAFVTYNMVRPVQVPFTSIGAFAVQSISMGAIGTVSGTDNTGTRHLQTELTKSITEGNPSTPSLKLLEPGMWRFRWVVKTGARSVSINAKQATTTVNQRPTLCVKANDSVGVPADLSATASVSSNWVTIGPISFTATGDGVVWVEARNNAHYSDTPAYFDHIVVT